MNPNPEFGSCSTLGMTSNGFVHVGKQVYPEGPEGRLT